MNDQQRPAADPKARNKSSVARLCGRTQGPLGWEWPSSGMCTEPGLLE